MSQTPCHLFMIVVFFFLLFFLTDRIWCCSTHCGATIRQKCTSEEVLFLVLLSNEFSSWWESPQSLDFALSEQNSLSLAHWAACRCPFFSLISIPLWIWPEKVRSLFCKSQGTDQCCYFSLKSDIWLDIFSTPTVYLLVFLHSLCVPIQHGGWRKLDRKLSLCELGCG